MLAPILSPCVPTNTRTYVLVLVSINQSWNYATSSE
jgi:hypothetical protein